MINVILYKSISTLVAGTILCCLIGCGLSEQEKLDLALLEEFIKSEGIGISVLIIDDSFQSELGTIYAIRVASEERPEDTLIGLVGIRRDPSGDYAVLASVPYKLNSESATEYYLNALRKDSLDAFYGAESSNWPDSAYWDMICTKVPPPDTVR